jgi:hypothetical protein
MPVFEGEDGAYEPVEMGLYKPYEVAWRFNAEDTAGSSCSSRSPDSMAKLDEKTCLDQCGAEGWVWDATHGCHNPAHQSADETTQPWYVQEVVPSVPNWFLAGIGAVILIGYFMFRKKEG